MIDIKEKLDLSSRNAGKIKRNREIFKQYKQYFDNITEFIYYYKNPEKAEKERYCKICGKKVPFDTSVGKYRTYCSRKCLYNDEEHREKIKQANLKTVAEKRDEIFAKRQQTKIERYGNANYNNPTKRAKTNIEKYGTDNLFKDVARMAQARKDKLGVEHALQRADLLKKSQDTLERHYGVRTTFKSKEIIAKKDRTNLERYGTVYPTQNQGIKDKIAKTNIARWGYVSASLNSEIKKKQQETLEKHYGVKTPFASRIIQKKARQTNKERYGEEVYRKSQDFKEKQRRALNLVGEDGLTGIKRRVKKYKENCKLKHGVENYSQAHITNKEFLTEEYVKEHFIKDGQFLLHEFCDFFNMQFSIVDAKYRKLLNITVPNKQYRLHSERIYQTDRTGDPRSGADRRPGRVSADRFPCGYRGRVLPSGGFLGNGVQDRGFDGIEGCGEKSRSDPARTDHEGRDHDSG